LACKVPGASDRPNPASPEVNNRGLPLLFLLLEYGNVLLQRSTLQQGDWMLRIQSTYPVVAIVSIFLCLPAFAGSFMSAEKSTDKSHLVITRTNGKKIEAPTLPKQVGFDSVKISPDGTHVGWLAMFPNVSYPVPMYLVVMDSAGHIKKFSGDVLIFEWCFLPDSKSVAYMSSSLHFTDGEDFEWRSLKDKHLLGEYEYPDDYHIRPELRAHDARAKVVKNAPKWVKCVPKSPIDNSN
jgi:hypothetical protein